LIENLTASIYQISARGELQLQFSTPMINTVNLSIINSSIIDIYIVPAQNRHEQDGFDLTKLNFTWIATDFVGDMLSIQLNFSNPTFISPLKDQDLIVWYVRPQFLDIFWS